MAETQSMTQFMSHQGFKIVSGRRCDQRGGRGTRDRGTARVKIKVGIKDMSHLSFRRSGSHPHPDDACGDHARKGQDPRRKRIVRLVEGNRVRSISAEALCVDVRPTGANLPGTSVLPPMPIHTAIDCAITCSTSFPRTKARFLVFLLAC